MSAASVTVPSRIPTSPSTSNKKIKKMKKNSKTIGIPTVEKPTVYERIKETLAVASQLIITAPLKLPPKVVAVAKYLALALGVLEAVESAAKKGDDDEE